MSASPEPEFDLELHFLPAWAQEPPSVNRYAKFEGRDEARTSRRPDSGGRRERDGRHETRSARPKDRLGQPGERVPYETQRRDGSGRGVPRRSAGREREAQAPALPDINVAFIPDEKGVDSLARQIKLTGRAYPLFGIALMILKKPERHQVRFQVVKKPDGQIAQPLFVCALDETLWLSEQDAVNHVLKRHFDTFYRAERTATEPPKGTYTFVAQCGMSGAILGPPNYHDYQSKVMKLHTERFSRVPFEVYKSRVRIVRDEAVVKQWLEEQSWKTEYACLNVPEPKQLASREETEIHFRETHLPNVIKPVESHSLDGRASRQLPDPALRTAVLRALDDQMRFPLRIATVLSQQFAARGLQFFKVNKTVTHVAVARPHYLDLTATPVSEGVKRIVEFINATPKCTRRKLLDSVAPTAPPTPDQPPTGSPASAETVEPTPEMTAAISDLHWLIHQGHVIEFANGILETARRPVPRPAKPAQTSPPVQTEAATRDAAESERHPDEPIPPIAPENATGDAVEPEPAPTAEASSQSNVGPTAEASEAPEQPPTVVQPTTT